MTKFGDFLIDTADKHKAMGQTVSSYLRIQHGLCLLTKDVRDGAGQWWAAKLYTHCWSSVKTPYTLSELNVCRRFGWISKRTSVKTLYA